MKLLDFMCVADVGELFDICDMQGNNIFIISDDTHIKDYTTFLDAYGNKQIKRISTFSSGGFQVQIEL